VIRWQEAKEDAAVRDALMVVVVVEDNRHHGEEKNKEDLMPNRDGTGPAGKGPRTGGQRGNCEGAKPRPYPRNGRGLGRGRRTRGK